MEQSRSQLVKSIVNLILFISLLTSFVLLYFVNETKEYLKGSTTFASRTEEVDKFDWPVLVICFEPSYKPSIFGNVSTDFSALWQFFVKENLIKDEEKLADILKSASYKLNEDVQIDLVIKDGNNISVKYYLEEGRKVMDGFQIDVYETHTMTYGVCYVVESTEKVNPWQFMHVFVKDLNSENGDKFSNLYLFIAARESWYGILGLTWPYFKLKKHKFSFNIPKRYYWMDMSVTSISYQKGHNSVEECIENWMSTNVACKKCSPIFFSFKNKKQNCQSREDNKCWHDWSFYGKNFNEYKKCLKPMKTTLYQVKDIYLEKVANQNNIIEIEFGFSSDQIEIKEETLMIGTSSYIGSVGGSLGLFLGFSVFTYLSCCIGKLIEFCSKF